MTIRTYLHRRARALACAAAAGAAMLAPMGAARADDIDIYSGHSTSSAANVLFFIDNTSNWAANNQAWNAADVYSTCTVGANAATITECQTNIEAIFYYGVAASSAGGPKRPWESGFSGNKDNQKLYQGQVELRALRYVLNSLVCSGTGQALSVNVGLMLWNTAGTVRSNGDIGGYIRRNVQPLTGTATTAGSSCKTLVDDLTTIDASITTPTFKGPSSADYGSAMFEAFKYFGGWTNPTLAATATAGAPVGAQGYGPIRYSNATSLEDATAFTNASKSTYAGPSSAGGSCGKDYLVVIGNQYPNAEPNSGPARFQGLNYSPTQLPADVSRYADEWAQFMANTDVSAVDGMQSIYTYAMNVYFSQPDSSQTKLLQSMATNGGIGLSSGYLEVGGDLNALVEGFSKILISVSAVNSVFTATTLPVSTTTQGSYLNQLFIGMFRPDAAAAPRWVGNLKQYQLGLDANGDLLVESATGQAALLASTGYFSPLATSLWTTPDVFFANSPSGTPLSSSDAPDGQIVEKGGVAEILRNANLNNSSSRKVYTLPASPTQGVRLSDYPFSSANAAVAGFGFTTDQINWVRGENNIAPDQDGAEYLGSYQGATSVMSLASGSARPSLHGDILHSRPVALNYGNGRVVVFYGSNDGFLRAVDGRQDTSVGGGSELWSFIAPEHYGMLMRLHDDTPALWLPSTDSSGNTAAKVIATSQKKDYAMDGPIGVFAQYNSSGVVAQAMIFVAMRRGGSTVYAFDVSDPAAPRLQWKISPSTPGFASLGQTWSTPRGVVFPPSTGLLDPIVVMGGGYDPSEDTQSSSGVGHGVYVINGRTGALLKVLPTDWSVPGDVTVVDSDGNGQYDRGYVADVRGNLYRIEMTDGNGTFLQPSSWTIVKIAALGGKVFFAPDVIPTRSFVAVLAGTGDREKPLMTSTSDNFFLVKDVRLGQANRGSVLTISDLTRVARVDNTTRQMVDVNTSADNPQGCYLQLATNGEKVVNAPTSVSGATYFGTNRPTPNDGSSCTGSLGEARSYQFPLFCGVPTSTQLEGGGLPPSPVGGLVSITNPDGSTRLVSFIIGSGKSTTKSSLEAWQPHSPIPNKRKRTYWHFENQNR